MNSLPMKDLFLTLTKVNSPTHSLLYLLKAVFQPVHLNPQLKKKCITRKLRKKDPRENMKPMKLEFIKTLPVILLLPLPNQLQFQPPLQVSITMMRKLIVFNTLKLPILTLPNTTIGMNQLNHLESTLNISPITVVSTPSMKVPNNLWLFQDLNQKLINITTPTTLKLMNILTMKIQLLSLRMLTIITMLLRDHLANYLLKNTQTSSSTTTTLKATIQ
jgi:hypothetical protein